MGANLPCSRGAGYRGGRLGTPGTPVSKLPPFPQPHLLLEQEGPRHPAPPLPPPPILRKRSPAADQMLRLRQHPWANAPPPPAAPPAASCLHQGTPGHPETRHPDTPAWESASGATPCARAWGGPRSPDCRYPRQQPAVTPGPERGMAPRPLELGEGGDTQEAKPRPVDAAAGPGASGSAMPGGTDPRPHCGARHSRQEGGCLLRAFLRMRIPRAPNSCASAGARWGKEGPGNPQPRATSGHAVPGPAHARPGTALSLPDTTTPPGTHRASCPVGPGGPVPPPALGPGVPTTPTHPSAAPPPPPPRAAALRWLRTTGRPRVMERS